MEFINLFNVLTCFSDVYVYSDFSIPKPIWVINPGNNIDYFKLNNKIDFLEVQVNQGGHRYNKYIRNWHTDNNLPEFKRRAKRHIFSLYKGCNLSGRFMERNLALYIDVGCENVFKKMDCEDLIIKNRNNKVKCFVAHAFLVSLVSYIIYI
jgi:hypothetical protein